MVGAALAQDGPRPFGRCVIGQPGLHRRQRLGPVLVMPPAEVPGPPLQQVGVGDPLQRVLAEVFVGQQLQPVQDGVLLPGLHLLVGLVQGLDRLFQDGLHPGTPLLPQAPGHPDHRVGGAVPIGEDAGVQQVDAGRAGRVGQIYEPNLVHQGLGDVFQDSGHQVGVGVHHHDGVAVAASGLLPQLVADYVVHQGGLAHAGAGHVEVVAAQQVLGGSGSPASPRRWCRPPVRRPGHPLRTGAAPWRRSVPPGESRPRRPAGATGRRPRGPLARCAGRTGRGRRGAGCLWAAGA